MILFSKRITATNLKRQAVYLDAKDLTRGIRNIGHQDNLKSSTPLIANLRIDWTFKDEAKKEEVSVIDLILLVLQLL